MEELIEAKKTFVTLEKVHLLLLSKIEFVKNIIVTTIYKGFESSKRLSRNTLRHKKWKQTELFNYFLYVMIEVYNTDDIDVFNTDDMIEVD